jgi:hypothetical protein
MSNSGRAEIHLDPNPTGHLDAALPGAAAPLRSLPQEHLAAGDPDVRGWQVVSDDGQPIGQVDDLLVDAAAHRVRYLSVSLDAALADGLPEVAGAAAGGPIPGTNPDASALPGMDIAAISGLSGLTEMLAEEFVRSTITEEELALARDGVPPQHRRVLVPIGAAAIDPDQRQVRVRGLLAAHAAGLPDYHGQLLTPEMEAGLRRGFGHA